MPDIDTVRLGLTKPEETASDDTWGAKLNANLDILDNAYTLATALGTVSQVAGVPTGALMESGSNANGQYMRLANGWQICTHKINNGALIQVSWTFPAAFVSAAYYVNAMPYGIAGTASVVAAGVGSATSISLRPGDHTGSLLNVDMFAIAVGRWF